MSVFKQALDPKPSHALSKLELYSQEYYAEHIKPLIDTEQKAGNLTSCGDVLNASCRFSKELLPVEVAEDNIKVKIRRMYEVQKDNPRDELDKMQDLVSIQW